ncbi:hypothetical protein JG491_00930 [Streptomyces sp. CRPSP2-6A1]|uniref:hypothetical protein n=1 Tax=Streptomyces TaxID=1883 RepID=UPI0018F07685|nr:hypothetical protein [Streptomyces sp. CRPSP2-6A1]MBJ6998663.1 hypothetical protein [Streptomyces sp. CRPSP2-6A1]
MTWSRPVTKLRGRTVEDHRGGRLWLGKHRVRRLLQLRGTGVIQFTAHSEHALAPAWSHIHRAE